MGNVLAAAPLNPPVPVPPEEPSGNGKNRKNNRNPGSVEDLHKKCKDIFPTPFEGARVIVNKGLSNHFQISHTINMSSVSPSGYRFGATYVGTKQVGPGEAYPVLLGDMDPSGNVNANIIHLFNERIKTKFVAQIQESKVVASQMTADYRGDFSTTSLTLGNIDLLNQSGIGVLHYLHSVTPTIDAGVEVAYQKGPQVPGGGMAVVSAAGRYKSPQNFILSGTLSTNRANVCYYHQGIDNLQLGVEVETDLRMGESLATFGYQVDLPKANLTFKGSVDSNWTVGAVLEKRLQPLPFTFLMSGHIIHARNPSYKFGMGLLIG